MITRSQIYERFETGVEMARVLGMTKQNASAWKGSDKPVPPERVLAVEKELGLSRHDLAPQVYPREPWCGCPACEKDRAGASTAVA